MRHLIYPLQNQTPFPAEAGSPGPWRSPRSRVPYIMLGAGDVHVGEALGFFIKCLWVSKIWNTFCMSYYKFSLELLHLIL